MDLSQVDTVDLSFAHIVALFLVRPCLLTHRSNLGAAESDDIEEETPCCFDSILLTDRFRSLELLSRIIEDQPGLVGYNA